MKILITSFIGMSPKTFSGHRYFCGDKKTDPEVGFLILLSVALT
jgi:hypothetical protein